eukprot:GFUD01018846.1.p1 GENE.GFUD01018846.1~~GFUD01018846.1.p1  ORF type:complete len:499 (+),score=131.10 GFUD01018846.1:381-1877(+)
MNQSVKTTNDWMSLFLGSSRSGSSNSSGYSSSRPSAYSRDSDSSVTSRYSRESDSSATSRYSRESDLSRFSRDSDVSRYSPSAAYSSSRYSSSSITSPPAVRRTQGYSTYSRFLPSSRLTDHSEEESENRHHDRYETRDRFGRDAQTEPEQREQNNDGRKNTSKSKSQVTVLNEGTIIIRRPGAADTSDEESDSEEENDVAPEPVEEKPVEPPPRDPLDVEEEALTEKLQTAGFLMSMPEEEQIKKRLLEIKQMRDNPEMFKPENTRNFKFTQVSSEVAKPSTAKEEEEKILLLRLGSRGIGEVEQTDVQVRLQEIWRDRREEVNIGIGRVEQHYEHVLNECSTEISELEGSINHKYEAIAKLQEELLVLSMRKERVATDMDKVTAAHQDKLETMKTEISELDNKSSSYSIVRGKKIEESSLPEDERSEVESELECPVCLDISRPPIYQCPEGHIICSACKPLLKACCQCDMKYTDPPIRCRFAEKLAAKYFKDEEDK